MWYSAKEIETAVVMKLFDWEEVCINSLTENKTKENPATNHELNWFQKQPSRAAATSNIGETFLQATFS